MDLDAPSRHRVLVDLGRHLKATGYSFQAPTPKTHALVNARPENSLAKSLIDIFGWCRPFSTAMVSADILNQFETAGVIETGGGFARSLVRYSTLDDLLFVHSAYPTTDSDAVFFGPDTYRFARLLHQKLGEAELPNTIIDIGCGSGAGGIFAGSRSSGGVAVVLGDVNERALSLARVNAELNDIEQAQVVRLDRAVAQNGRGRTVHPHRIGTPAGDHLQIRRLQRRIPARAKPGGIIELEIGKIENRHLIQLRLEKSPPRLAPQSQRRPPRRHFFGRGSR